ncbi:hypothetical protein AAZX31_06G165900 [Glycine max]
MEPGCLPALHQFRNLQIWSNVYLPPPSTIAELHRHPVNTNSASNSIDVVENKGANVMGISSLCKHFLALIKYAYITQSL